MKGITGLGVLLRPNIETGKTVESATFVCAHCGVMRELPKDYRERQGVCKRCMMFVCATESCNKTCNATVKARMY